ncbi:histidine kinase [Auritidibacter ignavus]|uniref:sensor histidine kinase n=1 Tax=Auritidibacter ignavus TaxID=678932 RepID=UPI00244A5F33|nr:ATP-binding protein [Auritidibacter ignavus]WGH90445.1 histidine kinase [Auritidibacter ignavus]
MTVATPEPVAHPTTGHPAPVESVMRWLRVVLHVMFAFLLVFATIRAVLGETLSSGMQITVVIVAVLVAAIYVAGTVWERRVGLAASRLACRYASVWLVAVIGGWTVLCLISAEFIWVMFPLVFVSIHVLTAISRLLALGCLLALLTVTIGAEYLASGAVQVAGVIGPVLGTVVAVVAYRVYHVLHDQAVGYRKLVEDLIVTRHELATSERQAGQLQERQRVSQEIHDTLAQGFSSLVLLSRAAQHAAADQDTARLHDQLHLMHDSAEKNLATARELVQTMADPATATEALDDNHQAPSGSQLMRQLGAMVQRHQAEARAQRQSVELLLRGEPAVEDQQLVIQTERFTPVLRIADQALTNALAHAAASTVVVTVTATAGMLTLDVFDDGTGFDPEAVDTEHHFGLSGMKTRAVQAGGELSVESAPGAGTVIGLRIPLGGEDD